MKKILFFTSLTGSLVRFVFAQQDNFSGLGSIIGGFNSNVIARLGVLLLALGVIAFFFGIVRFIIGQQSGDNAKAQTGRTFMVWGIVGLFVAFSVYGIITFAQNTLGVGNITTIGKPCTDFVNGCGSSGIPRNTFTPGPVVIPNQPAGNVNATAGGECNQNNIGASCYNGTGTCQNTAYGYVCQSNPKPSAAQTQTSVANAQVLTNLGADTIACDGLSVNDSCQFYSSNGVNNNGLCKPVSSGSVNLICKK